MTKTHNDSLSQEPDYYQEQIDELQARVLKLEKLVDGLCNIQRDNWKEAWDNFHKATEECNNP